MSSHRVSGNKNVQIETTDYGLELTLERMKKFADEVAAVEVGVIDADAETTKLAAIHEHGYAPKGIPKRAWLRGTMARLKGKISSLQREAIGRVIDGDWTMTQALNAIGEEIASDVKASMMRQGYEPKKDLQDATIKAKRRKGYIAPTVPLVATEAMYNAIKHRVKEQ